MGGVGQRIVTIAIAILVPMLASAQSQQLRDRDPELDGSKKVTGELQEANFHYGAFYLLSRFQIADIGYTQSSYVPTGESGVSLSVEAPHRLYFVPHKKTVFTAEVTPGYTFFAEDSEQRQLNYILRGDAHFLFNHLYLDAYVTKANQIRAHVSDVNRMATVDEEEIGLAGEVKYSSRTSAIFAVRKRGTEYPDDRFQPTQPNGLGEIPLYLLERDEMVYRGSFNHKTLPLTSFFVAGEVSDYSFDNATYYDSQRIYYGAGFSFDSGRTAVSLEAGPSKLDFEDANQRDFEGFTGRIGAARANGRWNYRAGAQRDLGFSIFRDNTYYVATSGSVGADYAATRRLTLRAGITAEQDVFETPVEGRKRKDTFSFSSVGFSYGLNRLRTGLDVGWYERDSTAFGDEDSGIRYVLHLSYTP